MIQNEALQRKVQRRSFLKVFAALVASLALIPPCGLGVRGKSGRVKEHVSDEALSDELIAITRKELAYISSCQYRDEGNIADGAINNVNGLPTWVVPGEMSWAIWALLIGHNLLHDNEYLDRATAAVNYFARIQKPDGSFYNQYNFAEAHPNGLDSYTRHTAQVMMAYSRYGYNPGLYASMMSAAEFIYSCQAVENKKGQNDGLAAGGRSQNGEYYTDRWVPDNCFAYLAYSGAIDWAQKHGDNAKIGKYYNAREAVLAGINDYLYDDTTHIWHTRIDLNGVPYNDLPSPLNYAPEKYDIPAEGTGDVKVGEWMHSNLQLSDGSVVQDQTAEGRLKASPGFSFEFAVSQYNFVANPTLIQYGQTAVSWAENSGLYHVDGGFIDWKNIETGEVAPDWQRFIDTSFNYIAAKMGGIDFVSEHFAFLPIIHKSK